MRRILIAGWAGAALLLANGCDTASDAPRFETECHDGLDEDRDGATDCDDGDCSYACVEHNCTDGLDSDQDGLTDCDDTDCSESTERCGCLDGVDNDGNGIIDCADSGCSATAECSAPPNMVKVAGGTFDQGCEDHYATSPEHTVTLPTFAIGVNNPTVEDYVACVDAGGCAPPAQTYEDHSYCTYGPHPDLTEPIRCVSWREASRYCGWAGGRLCSESEWRYAMREGTRAMGLEQWVVASSYAVDFLQDCWISSYGTEHPDGTLELDVPADGSAYIGGDCTSRTGVVISIFGDIECSDRQPLDADEIYVDVFFRCCSDVE